MPIGIWEIIGILFIVLILFGAGKLPQVMGDVAKGVKSFKEGMKDDEEDKTEKKPSKPKTKSSKKAPKKSS